MPDLSKKIETIDFEPSLIAEQVTKTLSDAILEGIFTGGEKLIEAELQKKFGISRSPIREAFRILEKSGLVEMFPRKGTFVKKITVRDVQENFPVRAYLEGLAARMATSRLSSQDIQKMTKALDRMEKANRKKDYRAYMKYHIVFHEVFINGSGNETLIQILRNLRQHAIWFRLTYFYFKDSFDPVKIHGEILDQFAAKNSNRAEKLVKSHIMDALNGFLDFLESRTDDIE